MPAAQLEQRQYQKRDACLNSQTSVAAEAKNAAISSVIMRSHLHTLHPLSPFNSPHTLYCTLAPLLSVCCSIWLLGWVPGCASFHS